MIGGGLVGMAVALGLARRGLKVAVFDEGDRAIRASRGNFGLVWVQGKGVKLPDYARWTRRSAGLWPDFAANLADETGTDLQLSQPGGMSLFLSEDEADEALAGLSDLRDALGGDYPFEYLGHNGVKAMIPEIGPDVVGATWTPMDGHVNPLHLLRALHAGFARAGGRLVNGATVDAVAPAAGGFRIARAGGDWQAGQVVLCAGLGNARLAPMLGLSAPVVAQRGQVLITERIAPFLEMPTVHVRQTGEGTVQIGDSKEDAGLDDGTRPDVVAAIARRAVRYFPLLAGVRMVRAWGALRVMSPDGFPIYQKSATCPGATVVNCHSGVTLAAVHAGPLAGWIAGEAPPQDMEVFSAARFGLPAAG